MKYPLGTEYRDRHGRVNTVIDYYTTRNMNGDIVRQRYVVKREAMPGAWVVDYDVVETTIAKALYNRGKQA